MEQTDRRFATEQAKSLLKGYVENRFLMSARSAKLRTVDSSAT